MIEAQDLHKRFGDTVAVDTLTFTAPVGAVTGLLGPNGAGKTTALRLLCGLLQPGRGRARIDELDMANAAQAARRRLGVLSETPGLYAGLTAREHLVYAGRLHGLGGAFLRTAVEREIARLGLGAIADRAAAGFSQGERRRVALACSLVHGPPNVVLDEPTNGLDVLGIRTVRRLVRSLAAAGTCVLLSSHVMQEVSAVCDRVVVVADGRVVAEDTPSALRARTGQDDLESAFVHLIGSEEGLN